MTERNVDASIVTVYALFSLAGILLATSFLFSGFTLVLAYIIEITASFFTVTYLGLPRKVVYGIASLYTLPLIGSLESFTSPSWNSGIWHVDALVLYSMFGALLFSALWLMHIRTVASQPWSRGMAAVFGILSFFFIYGVVSVVMQSLFSWSEARVTTYVLWALISLGYILYSLRAKVPASVAYVSTLSLGIPLFASIPSFVSGAWLDGVRHIDSFGVFSITIILGLTALLITERYCKEYDRTYGRLLAGVCVVSIGYFFAVLYAFWHGLFTDFTIAHVAVYVSYAIVLYSLTAVFVLLRATISWIEFTLVAFVLPVLMSLSSINVHGWSEGVLSPDAVGLYGLATLCVMIGFGLKNKYTASSEAAATRITMWSRTFFILTFVYSIVLVWCLSQSVIIGEEAVSVALFVYTISGLFAYQYGRRNMKRDFTYAGVALLSLVVFRLVLVDVWQMEVLSRIITFLGIGFLFIAAALFEKLPGKQ
jgi:hypothetical protein